MKKTVTAIFVCSVRIFPVNCLLTPNADVGLDICQARLCFMQSFFQDMGLQAGFPGKTCFCGSVTFPKRKCLVTRPKYPPYRETGVAIPLFPVVSQTIAATPRLLSLQVAYRSPKTGLTRGVSQKTLASEAYRAIGAIARNSIANRAIVGHQEKVPFGPRSNFVGFAC